MATTSISGEKGVRLASAVAARPAMPLSAASDGLERFSIPVEGPSSGAIPVSNGAAEPKAAIRDGAAAKPVATASLGSAIAQSALPISDLVRLAKATIPSSQPSTDSAAGQKADAAETGLPRAREDEDPATPPSEAGLGGFPWLSEQQTNVVAKPAQMPQQGGKAGLPIIDGAEPSPVQARQGQVPDAPPGQALLPIAGNGRLSASRVQTGSALPSSTLPPSTMVQAAATAPVQAIVSEPAEANPITTADEPSEDVAVPADGMVPNATGMMTLAFAPPESVAPPPAANAPAMATQAGAAPPPNTGEIVSHGIGAARAPDGRLAALPALGTDRSASSERETISVKAFDEFASGSAMASGDLASAPATPFGPAPAAPLPAPALDPAAILPQAQAVPVPLGAVAMTIGLRSLAGSNRFEISLDPKDLGRIDVNLDIDKDNGTVTAHLTVDRPETLALLQRDVGNLQQALSQAGFDAGEVGINLSLRSDTGSTGGNGAERDGGGSRDGRSGNGGSDLKEQRLPNDAVPLRMLRGLGGLDIRI